MIARNDRVKSHPVHQRLVSLARILHEATRHDLAPDAQDAVERAEAVRRRLEAALRNVAPELLTISALDDVTKAVDALADEAGALWGGLPNPGMANERIDELVGKVASFMRLAPGEEARAIVEDVAELRERLGALSRELEDVRRATEHARRSERKRAARAYSRIREHKHRARQLVDAIGESAHSELRPIVDAIEERASEIESIREHVAGLASDTAMCVLSGAYRKEAQKQERLATRYRWFALGFMSLMAALVGAVVWIMTADGALPDGADWTVHVARLLATLVLAIPGLYCARESRAHRRREQEASRLAIELDTSRGYMQDLPDEQVVQVRSALGLRFFAGARPESGAGGSGVPSVGLDDLFKAIELVLKREEIAAKHASNDGST